MSNCVAIIRVQHDTRTLLPALQSCVANQIGAIVIVDPFDRQFYRKTKKWNANKDKITVVATMEEAERTTMASKPISVHLHASCYMPKAAFRHMVDQVATHERYTGISAVPRWQCTGGAFDWLLYYFQVMLWWQAWRYGFHVRRSDGCTVECRQTFRNSVLGGNGDDDANTSSRPREYAPTIRHPQLTQWWGQPSVSTKRSSVSGWRRFGRLVHEAVNTAGISNRHQWTTWLWLTFYTLCMYWCASTLSGEFAKFWTWSYFSAALYMLFFVQHTWILLHYIDGSQTTRSILLAMMPLYPFVYFLFAGAYTLVYLFGSPSSSVQANDDDDDVYEEEEEE